jgi:hypothetical protein
VVTAVKKRLFMAALSALISASCKPELVSSTKSFLGLEELQNDDLKANGDQYQTLLDLSDWFQGFKVSFSDNDRSNRTVSARSVTARNSTSYQAALVKYIDAELARNRTYLAAIDRKDKTAIKKLLTLESLELYDIAMVILNPAYEPVTGDKLALLIKSVDDFSFTDVFAEPFLAKVFSRTDQRSAIENLRAEQINYRNALIASVLASDASLARFRTRVMRLGKQLARFREQLNGEQAGDGLSLIDRGAETPTAMSGPNAAFLSYAEGAADTGVAANTGGGAVAAPQLSIFAGTAAGPATNPGLGNVTVGAAGAGAAAQPAAQPAVPTPVPSPVPTPTTTTNPINPSTPTANGDGLERLVALIVKLLSSSGLGLTEVPPQDKAPVLPPKPRFSCAREKLTGKALVLCERFGATSNVVIQKNPNWQSKAGFGLAAGYSFDIIRNYATKVQNQGSEGACTAYGLVHTLEAYVQPSRRGATFSSAELWSRYGDYTSSGAIRAARSGLRSPDGTVVATTGSSYINSIAEAKAALDKGQAIYACSTIDNSWYNTSHTDATVSCSGSGGGHCYSIQGYGDAQQVFIVKNSWGSYYGQKGYIYLPFNCCQNGDCSFILPQIKI